MDAQETAGAQTQRKAVQGPKKAVIHLQAKERLQN